MQPTFWAWVCLSATLALASLAAWHYGWMLSGRSECSIYATVSGHTCGCQCGYDPQVVMSGDVFVSCDCRPIAVEIE